MTSIAPTTTAAAMPRGIPFSVQLGMESWYCPICAGMPDSVSSECLSCQTREASSSSDINPKPELKSPFGKSVSQFFLSGTAAATPFASPPCTTTAPAASPIFTFGMAPKYTFGAPPQLAGASRHQPPNEVSYSTHPPPSSAKPLFTFDASRKKTEVPSKLRKQRTAIKLRKATTVWGNKMIPVSAAKLSSGKVSSAFPPISGAPFCGGSAPPPKPPLATALPKSSLGTPSVLPGGKGYGWSSHDTPVPYATRWHRGHLPTTSPKFTFVVLTNPPIGTEYERSGSRNWNGSYTGAPQDATAPETAVNAIKPNQPVAPIQPGFADRRTTATEHVPSTLPDTRFLKAWMACSGALAPLSAEQRLALASLALFLGNSMQDGRCSLGGLLDEKAPVSGKIVPTYYYWAGHGHGKKGWSSDPKARRQKHNSKKATISQNCLHMEWYETTLAASAVS